MLTVIFSHSINTVSFSFDGEYLAMATAGSYIDIVSRSDLSWPLPLPLRNS